MREQERIVIAGSGRMALSIGDYFLDKGGRVYWLCGSDARYQQLCRRIDKRRKRQRKYFPDMADVFAGGCYLLGGGELPPADIVIESTTELVEKKQRVLSFLAEVYSENTLFCTNSSSILPEHLLAGCLGTHFFYPVSLSPLVELSVPEGVGVAKEKECVAFLKKAGLAVVKERHGTPPLANRLLLAMQSICFEALRNGMSPDQVDEASVSELMPMGQLTLMDTIGLDLVMAAVLQYGQYTPLGEVDFEGMCRSLQQLIKQGKRGKVNGDGLLVGQKLPWNSQRLAEIEVEGLRLRLYDNFILACREALRQNILDHAGLQTILEKGFQGKNVGQHIQD